MAEDVKWMGVENLAVCLTPHPQPSLTDYTVKTLACNM